MDIAETAVAHCRERFAGDGHVSFHVNDGTSLAMVADGAIDLIFNMGSYERGTYDPNAIHWRATSVSADLVDGCARAEGLSCVSQETVCWGQEHLLNDCFSVITRAGSRWDRERQVAANTDFLREMDVSRGIAALYPPAPRTLAYRADERAQTADAAALELATDGDAAAARALLHPEHAAARENLGDLRR